MQQPRNGDADASTPPEAGSAPDAPDAGGGKNPGSWRRNFVTRAATGLPALAAVLAVVAWAPAGVIAAVVAVAGVYGTYEFVCLVTGCGAPATGDQTRTGAAAQLPGRRMLVAAGVIGIGGVLGTPGTLNAGLLLGVLITGWSVWFAEGTEGRDSLRDLGVALAGLLLVPWLLGHLSLLVHLPGGRGFLAFLLLAAVFNDTAAYLVGRFLGRHLLLPTVSPKKTVEGALGGLCGGMLAGTAASIWLGTAPTALSLPVLLGLGALLAAAGQAGDLLESKLKRLTHAGDSGNFLPGHGGMLDRLDVFLLSGPLSYHLLALLSG